MESGCSAVRWSPFRSNRCYSTCPEKEASQGEWLMLPIWGMTAQITECFMAFMKEIMLLQCPFLEASWLQLAKQNLLQLYLPDQENNNFPYFYSNMQPPHLSFIAFHFYAITRTSLNILHISVYATKILNILLLSKWGVLNGMWSELLCRDFCTWCVIHLASF